ncbi:MAG: hypothetical protein AAGA70_12105 [Pseudomonadota bacterium]
MAHLVFGVLVGLVAAIAAGFSGFGVLGIMAIYATAGTAGLISSAALQMMWQERANPSTPIIAAE